MVDRPEVRVLGGVELRDGAGRVVVLGGPRQRRLFAALIQARGRAVAAETLVDCVWGSEDQPRNATAALRTYISRLRSSLANAGVQAGALTTSSTGYRLDTSGLWIDADQLVELVASARSLVPVNPEAAYRTASEAVGLATGPPYGDLSGELWALAETANLTELLTAAAEVRVDALVALQRHDEAIADLGRLISQHPVRERFREQLALALYRAGRQAEALRALDRARRKLRETAGLEPGPGLRDLEAAILRHDPGLMPMASVSLAEELQPGARIRGYEIGRQVGSGVFSMVFEGTQPALDRAVALKVIRAEFADRPEFITRFQSEAHVVARLEHPHIVPLYDFWREPSRAVLVMRLLRGGTLEQELTEHGPLTIPRAKVMISQLGAALESAHRAGVVHRDVKPANVFLDGDGNFYLGDFGIALDVIDVLETGETRSVGSPAYASPEQLRGLPVGTQTDVWAFGVTLFECLAGQLPFPGELTEAALLRRMLTDPLPSIHGIREDVPEAIDRVLSQATAAEPARRFPTVAALVRAVERAWEREATPPDENARTQAVRGDRNPYKGLRQFDEADAGDFFGRVRLVDLLVARIDHGGMPGRILALVGPSGSGKSSVVRAGLLPALRAGALAGSDRWFITSLSPGDDPFAAFVTAMLGVATIERTEMEGLLHGGEHGLSQLVKAVVPAGRKLVLFIDQFEELFTLTSDARERGRFLEGLSQAVADRSCPLLVVLALRADFFDRPLAEPSFAPALRDGTVPIVPLAPDELEQAITGPAARVGVGFEHGLVSRIVADIVGQPSALPILQYALTELFETRNGSTLTAADFEQQGGVSGAVARRAEQLYLDSAAEEQQAIRRLFLRLVAVGAEHDIRRRAARQELEHDAAVVAVADSYGAARLLIFDRDRATSEPTLEIAHDALLQAWPRLHDWLDEDRNGRRLHQALTTAALEWERDDAQGELWRGARLESALQWAETHGAHLNEGERRFLAAAVRERDAGTARQQRQVQRLRRSLLTVAVALTLAMVATAVALSQQRSAARNADTAAEQAKAAHAATQAANAATRVGDISRLIAQARNESDNDRNLAMLLAVEAARLDGSPAAHGAILGSLLAEPRLVGAFNPLSTATAVGTQRNGTVVVVGLDGTVSRFNPGTGQEIGAPWRPTDLPINLFLANGWVAIGEGQVALTNTSGQARVYRVDDGRPVSPVLITPWPQVAAIPHFSADGAQLLLGGGEGTDARQGFGEVRIFDIGTGMEIGDPLRAHTARISSLSSSADGRWLAVGSMDRTASIWDLSTRTLAVTLAEGHRNALGSVAISPDGTTVATSTFDPVEVFLWERASGSLLAGPLKSGTLATNLAFSPDGTQLADYTGADRQLRVWAVPSGALRVAAIDTQGVGAIIGFAPDGRSIYTPGSQVRAWSTGPALALGRVIGANSPTRVALNRDGSRAVLTAPGRPGALIRTDTGDTVAELPSLPPDPLWAAFPEAAVFDREDSFYLASAGGPRRFNATTGQATGPSFVPQPDLVAGSNIDLSRDGRKLAVSGPGGVVVVYDVASGAPLFNGRVAADQRGPAAIRFDATGEYLLTYFIGAGQYVLDIANRTVVAHDPNGLNLASSEARAENVAFDTANHQFVFTDPVTLQPTREPLVVTAAGSGGAQTISPDGSILVVSSRGGSQLYDAPTGRALGPPVPSYVNITTGPPNFSADGTFMAVPRQEGGAYIWATDPALWKAAACHIAGRNLSADEWATYQPNGGAHRQTCPQWPLRPE